MGHLEVPKWPISNEKARRQWY